MWLLAQTQHGLFTNDTAISHEEAMNQVRGNGDINVHEEHSEEDSDESETAEDSDGLHAEEQEASGSRDDRLDDIHDAVVVPDVTDPFLDEELMQAFTAALEIVREQGMLPEGYGLLPEEWDDGKYPAYWVIKSGRRGKDLTISLPDAQWRARSELWGQALDIVNRLTYMLDVD
jgi:hypothetical protein